MLNRISFLISIIIVIVLLISCSSKKELTPELARKIITEWSKENNKNIMNVEVISIVKDSDNSQGVKIRYMFPTWDKGTSLSFEGTVQFLFDKKWKITNFEGIDYEQFSELQALALAERVRKVLDMIATGLEAYYIDNNTYPPPDYFMPNYPVVPHLLNTPVEYLTGIPIDPFSLNGKQGYRYFTGPEKDTTKTYWIIISNGPDKKPDLDISKNNPDNSFWPNLMVASRTYDPTNGPFSSGDIWRYGP